VLHASLAKVATQQQANLAADGVATQSTRHEPTSVQENFRRLHSCSCPTASELVPQYCSGLLQQLLLEHLDTLHCPFFFSK